MLCVWVCVTPILDAFHDEIYTEIVFRVSIVSHIISSTLCFASCVCIWKSVSFVWVWKFHSDFSDAQIFWAILNSCRCYAITLVCLGIYFSCVCVFLSSVSSCHACFETFNVFPLNSPHAMLIFGIASKRLLETENCFQLHTHTHAAV